jgi:transcriptional regulator with XRE-family HTH domain
MVTASERKPLLRYRNSPLTQLQVLRLARQKTLAQLGDACDVDASRISLWERFRREPPAQHRTKYALALDITPGELGRIVYEGCAKARKAARS